MILHRLCVLDGATMAQLPDYVERTDNIDRASLFGLDILLLIVIVEFQRIFVRLQVQLAIFFSF